MKAKIAIVSPGSPVRRDFVIGACDTIRRRGFVPMIMPHALGPADGIYASSLDGRISDFVEAWRNPEVGVILCARGGYGSVQMLHILSSLIPLEGEMDRKPLVVGFSDITAFHCWLNSNGVPSLHGPMCKDISLDSNQSVDRLFEMIATYIETGVLTNQPLDKLMGSSAGEKSGELEGTLVGGNFATLDALIGTPFDPLKENTEDKILFVEDIAEPIYKINRMLWHLYLAGYFQKLKGFVAGQFTEYSANASFPDMESMIYHTLRQFGFQGKVLLGFPAGHVDCNMPLALGSKVTL